MADIQQDLYGLTYSTSFQIQGTQEEAVNLTLPPAPSLLATVVGTVTDGTVPIPNATVKLFDSTGMPYQHTMTDAAGEYTLDGIPAGTYSIAAVAPDYLMSPAAGVTLSTGDTITIPLTCTADATLALGAVAGTLTVAGTAGTPLGGAKVSLLNSLGDTVATTYTADDGEFLFYDVADGIYTLLASADGYVTCPHDHHHHRRLHLQPGHDHSGGFPDLQWHGQRRRHGQKRQCRGRLLRWTLPGDLGRHHHP